MNLSLDKIYSKELEDYCESITIDGQMFLQQAVESTICFFEAAFRVRKDQTGLYEQDLPNAKLARHLCALGCLHQEKTENRGWFYTVEPTHWNSFVTRINALVASRKAMQPKAPPVLNIPTSEQVSPDGMVLYLSLARPLIPMIHVAGRTFPLAYLQTSLQRIREGLFIPFEDQDSRLLEALRTLGIVDVVRRSRMLVPAQQTTVFRVTDWERLAELETAVERIVTEG